MDDVEAIKQLKARYFRTMDTKDWAGLRQVFTDDVVMDTTDSGGSVVMGADVFVVFLQQTLAEAVTVHHGHTPEITLTSSTTATGVWALHDEIEWPDGRRAFAENDFQANSPVQIWIDDALPAGASTTADATTASRAAML